jgi:hypothetical protein
MPNWVYNTIRTHKSNEEFVKQVIELGGICQYIMPMPEEIKNTNSPNSIVSKEEYAIKESVNEGEFKVDDLVYNKRTKTIGIVRMGNDKYGEVKTDADGNVSVDELEKYNPIKFKHQTKAKVAPSTEKEVNSRGLFNQFKMGSDERSMHYHYQTQEMVDALVDKYGAANWYDWAHLHWGTKWGDCRMSYDIDGDELCIRYETAWGPLELDIVEKFISNFESAQITWEEEQGFGMAATYENGEFHNFIEWEIPEFKHTVWMDTDIPSTFNKDNFVQEAYVYLEEPYENHINKYEPGWHCQSDWYTDYSKVTDQEMIDKLESLKDNDN